MFKRLLVPIDGSRLALKAAELAIGLAKQFDAELTLLHVTRKFVMPDALKEYLKTEHLTGEPVYDIDDATRKVIENVRDQSMKEGIKRVTTEFKEGKPSRTIVEYARHHGIDAVVMGSRGLTDIEGALLGSVSHKVASLAPCTVIIVK